MDALSVPSHGLHLASAAPVQHNQAFNFDPIVEISSDEESDASDGQPESSGRALQLSPSVKRAVTIDSDEDDTDSKLLDGAQYLDSVPTKRRKHDHSGNMAKLDRQYDALDLMEAAELDQAPQAMGEYLHDFVDDGANLAFRPFTCLGHTNTALQTVTPKRLENDVLPLLERKGKGKATSKPTPPYYDDPKFDIRMFCGPGYEKFPIVLGSVPEHQDVCDEWDRTVAKRSTRRRARRACRAALATYINDTLENESSDDTGTEIAEDVATELELLYKVQEVFPDIQRDFALDKIRIHVKACFLDDDADIQLRPSLAAVVSSIIEEPDYPRQEKSQNPPEPSPDGTGITIEWRRGSDKSKTYQRDAVGLLAGQFDHVPTHFIHKIIQEKLSLYESYLHVNELEMKYATTPAKERHFRRSHQPRVILEKKYMTSEHGSRSKEHWANLVNELQAAKQKVERNRLLEEKREHERRIEEENLQKHKASGQLVECQCCFDDEIPINRSISCEDAKAHWFCFTCILRMAENQVGLMKHEMMCMHQSGCKANLAVEGIRQAVPSKLRDKLAFYQQQSEIAAACIEGLEQCPFCDFKAICDSIDETSVFQCQNPDCMRISCRKCNEESHLPKSCEESKVDRRLSARHQVEEARSQAMMRTCPKCKVKIIKEIGCNKMRCSKCGCVMCYVCKMDISSRKDGGYGHFHDNGAKCVLYDKDFDRHETEADEAEKEAIKKVRLENTDIDEKLLQIETGIPKKSSVPPKDELRLGWGHPLHADGGRHARRNEAFEAAVRLHRARFNEAYERIGEQHAQAKAAARNDAQAGKFQQPYPGIEPFAPPERVANIPAQARPSQHQLHAPQQTALPHPPSVLYPGEVHNYHLIPQLPGLRHLPHYQPHSVQAQNLALFETPPTNLIPELKTPFQPATHYPWMAQGTYPTMMRTNDWVNQTATRRPLVNDPNINHMFGMGQTTLQNLDPDTMLDNTFQVQPQPVQLQQQTIQEQHPNGGAFVNNFFEQWNAPNMNLDPTGNSHGALGQMMDAQPWNPLGGMVYDQNLNLQTDQAGQTFNGRNNTQTNAGFYY